MGSGVLTELGFEGEGRAKSMAMLTGGGAGTVIAGGVRRPFSGRLDPAGRLVVHLRWCHVVREVRKWPAARKKRIFGGAETHRSFGPNSDEARAPSWRRDRRESPRAAANLLRGWGGLGCSGAAVPRRGAEL
jgi:hypothetical protein